MILALRCILVFTILFSPLLSRAQFVSSLPQCIQNCISQSQFDYCSISDIRCLCRASAGNFLPDLVTCVRGNCDLDATILLEPLRAICIMAGAPIPNKAFQNAVDQATSVEQITTTVTVGSTSVTGYLDTSTTIHDGYSDLTTITGTKAQIDGLTITLTYPVTLWRTSSSSGPESETTSTYLSRPSTSHDEYLMSTTVTTQTTPYQSATSMTATLKGAQTSSSMNKATTGAANSQDEANSSPFKDSNSSGTRGEVGISMGLTGLLLMGAFWF